VEALVHGRTLGKLCALAITATALLTACLPESPYLPRSSLQNEPAAKLRYPAATQLGRVSTEREMTFDGPLPAIEGAVFGADVNREDLFAYYDRELRGLGWQQDLYEIYRTTVETDAWGWCKPRMSFRLAIKDRDRAYDPSFYKGQTYRTVFEANLQGRDADVTCPKR
jgi:hypothetical protein